MGRTSISIEPWLLTLRSGLRSPVAVTGVLRADGPTATIRAGDSQPYPFEL